MDGRTEAWRDEALAWSHQDANLSLTGSRGLLGEVMERNKTISWGQGLALRDVVWNYLETLTEHFPYVGCCAEPHPV